jgi:hypothetical protein
MPVVAKLLTSQDIIHGLASVNSGKSTPTYDPLPRTRSTTPAGTR